ncbi:MAG: ankyrin repeat domain-containing protein [Rhodospirillales bacterium]|nr:ankyrin repeat domain-containing protein [Rhodospirillales bacterium]
MITFATAPAAAQTPPTAAETAAYTGLHAAAARDDAAEIARLLAVKADPEARDGAGRTAAHVAAFAAAPDALRALAKGGADLRALENRRYDVVTIAAVRDDAAMVRLALSLGGDARLITSPYDGTALIAAAHLGHDEVVRALIEGGAPLDHVNNLGWTALMEAVVLGDGGPRHVACARALLAAGTRRDLPDRDGVTPLEHAKRRGMREMVAAFEAAAR